MSDPVVDALRALVKAATSPGEKGTTQELVDALPAAQEALERYDATARVYDATVDAERPAPGPGRAEAAVIHGAQDVDVRVEVNWPVDTKVSTVLEVLSEAGGVTAAWINRRTGG